MSKSVGLEIHAKGVRAVEVTGRGKNFRVVRYTEIPLVPRGGAPDPEELQDALVEIFRSQKFGRNHVVASLESHDTVIREIPVPFKSEDQIRKVVKFEAEHHLHDCDADDVIVQYTRVAESADGANLLVFAIRKADISRRIEYTRAAGVEPLSMDIDALAVHNVVDAAGWLEETPNCVLLHIGRRSTEMVFVVGSELRAVRSVRMGIDSIAQGLARDMDIDVDAAGVKVDEIGADQEGDLFVPVEGADEKKDTDKSHAELERDLFHQKRDEFLARLKREFVRSSAALRGAGARPERIVLCGAGLAVAGLPDLLAQRLGLSVDVFAPSEQFNCKHGDVPKAEFDAGAPVAIGLAIKQLGADALGLDFRQEELTVANRFELLKGALAVTVTLVFLSLMAASFYFVNKRNDLQQGHFRNLLTAAYKPYADVANKFSQLKIIRDRDRVQPEQVERNGPSYEAINRFLGSLRGMQRKLEREVGGGTNLEPIESALYLWNQVFEEVKKNHEDVEYIDFAILEFKQNEVELGAVMRSASDAERLAEKLRKMKIFEDFRMEPLSYTPLPETDFQQTKFLFKRDTRRGGRGRR